MILKVASFRVMKLKFKNIKEKQEFRVFKKDLEGILHRLKGDMFFFNLYVIEQHYLNKLSLYLMRRIKEKNLHIQTYPYWNEIDIALISRIVIKFLERIKTLRYLLDEDKSKLFSLQVRWSYVSLINKPKRVKRKIFKLTSLEASYLYPETLEG